MDEVLKILENHQQVHESIKQIMLEMEKKIVALHERILELEGRDRNEKN